VSWFGCLSQKTISGILKGRADWGVPFGGLKEKIAPFFCTSFLLATLPAKGFVFMTCEYGVGGKGRGLFFACGMLSNVLGSRVSVSGLLAAVFSPQANIKEQRATKAYTYIFIGFEIKSPPS
jgi:hypothetical protein